MSAIAPPQLSRPRRKAPPIEHVRFLLGTQLRELEIREEAVLRGIDPEQLHKFRVATRRARALITTARPVIGSQLEQVAEELKWLGGELGPSRDLDVLALHLEGLDVEIDPNGLALILSALEGDRGRARARLHAALASGRYRALLFRFEAELGSLEAVTRVRLDELAAAEYGRLHTAYRRLGKSPANDEIHALRIKAKRLRYASELAASAHGKRLRAVAKRAERLQDIAGAHHDAVFSEEAVRDVVTEASILAAGQIIRYERRRMLDARRRLPKAKKKLDRAAAKAF